MSRMDTQGAGPEGTERAEEDRLDLAAAALRNERHNRPTYLVVGAGLLLVVCAAFLVWSLFARASAGRELDRQREVATKLAAAVGRLKDLQTASTSPGAMKANAQIEDIRSRLQTAAARADVTDAAKLIPRHVAKAKSPGLQRVHFDFDAVRDPRLEPLLKWLRTATEEIPGLEVYSVTLKPEQSGWMMKVTFTRWETAG